ncbi:hypothetical protein ACHAPA_011117 [Fusarium lateritium]
MRLILLFNALALLLVGQVHAGSSIWEVNTASLSKRAISIHPGRGNGAVRRWPDKTLTYAFANREAEDKLTGIFAGANEMWGELRENGNGFKYTKIGIKDCEKKRAECLVINYNDKGYLSTTVGVQPVDKNNGYFGPVMHLSDKEHVGNLDATVNAAHELGHAWGLWHEHQNPNFWHTSEFNERGWISHFHGEIFETKDYKCENFNDYEESHERMIKYNQGLKDEDKANAISVESLCRSPATARKFRFSAMEWAPQANVGREPDSSYDAASLMLYPSGAGGKGDARRGSDNRLPILTYPDGLPISLREGPSPKDVSKLLDIYGRELMDKPVLLSDKANPQRGFFDLTRVKDALRGGDTKAGLC